MEHPAVVAKKNCLKNLRNLIIAKLLSDFSSFFWRTTNLGKEVPCCGFFERATFADEVKKVLKKGPVLIFSS